MSLNESSYPFVRKLVSYPARLVLLTIWLYKRFVSPFLPATCRFYPSCSDYALESVRRKGLFRGGLTALRRLCRCHPFRAGGYDPVRQEGKESQKL